MFDVFELFRQAQGGAAFDNLARAYGMSPDQMRAAVAALTPAFAQGFQRQAQSDDGARRFAELFRTEDYARAFDAHAAMLDQQARGAGDDALRALFGSKEVSRAVAAQASAASGVQAEIIRKVLPALAGILMGGFMKAAQGAGQATGGQQGFPGPMGDVFGGMFGGAQRVPEGGANPQNPFQDWFSNFGRPAAPGDKAETPPNPMGEAMGDILNSMFGGPQAQPAPQTKPDPEPEPEKAPAGTRGTSRPGEPAEGTPFDELVETGRELSAQNAKAMERIFDAFFGGAKPKD